MSIRGATVKNGSYVDIDDLDDISANGTELCNAHALLCKTDKTDCCHSLQTGGKYGLGDWYFPSGTSVNSVSGNQGSGLNNFFARSRGLSVIYMYRYGRPSGRGRFYCVVPTAGGVSQTLYANVCELAESST